MNTAVVALILIALLGGLIWRVLRIVRSREASLRASEMRFRELFEQSNDGVFIAELREAERILSERTAQLTFALDATGVGMWLNELPLGDLNWDAKTKELFFVPAHVEPTIELFWSRLHPDDREATRVAVESALRDGTLYSIDHRVVHPDTGEVRWLRSAGRATYNSDGVATRFDGINYDITGPRQAESDVRQSEQRFRGLGDALPMIVSIARADGAIEYVSPYWTEFSGRSSDDFINGDWLDAIHPDHREFVMAQWREALAMGTPYEYEFMARGAAGEFRWLLARGVPVLDAQGAISFWVNVAADIHRRRLIEETLREADRRKDEFLATLAHELRNPLAPVRNAVQLLHMKGPAFPELQWARDVIDRQVQQMARLIDDLMDVSRISQGKLELMRDRMALVTVIQGAVETSRPLIEQHGHDLTVILPTETVYLDADLTRLAQVFANLLNNAAKYTERGGRIVLTAERQGSDVVVSVRDSGIGIPRDKLGSVFELFSQVHGPLERSRGGLGIGLSLVKRLVEMHGGTIEARSEGPGSGSEFVVRLPVVVEQPAVSASRGNDEQDVVASSLRLLVVDDNRDAADSLSMMLRLMGHEIDVAYDGEAALRAAEEFRPQVILLDIGLPKLNGYEVCRAIRQRPWGKRMVVIAVTGWGQLDDKQKAEDAGFDRHMIKPVNPRGLIRLLDALSAGQLG